MPSKYIVFGPHDPAKREQARRLRKELTPAEKALWQRLKGHQVQGLNFRRQQVIDGFIVDFYCHRARLAVEVDGEIHLQQKEYDAQRDAALATRGITVLHFSNARVLHALDEVIAEIAKAGQTSPPPGAGAPSPSRDGRGRQSASAS